MENALCFKKKHARFFDFEMEEKNRFFFKFEVFKKNKKKMWIKVQKKAGVFVVCL
jgi:hypothetical protein